MLLSSHVYVNAPLALIVAIAPLHIDVLAMFIVGKGFTFICAVDVDVQALLSMAVTIYVLNVLFGNNVNEEPLLPFDQI